MDQLTRNKYILNRANQDELFLPLAEGKLKDFNDAPYFKMDDKTVGFAIAFDPMQGAGTEDVKRLHTLISTLYPKESIMQISMFASPNVMQMTRFFKEMHQTDDAYLKTFIDDRAAYIENSTKAPLDVVSQTLCRKFECLLTLKMPRDEFPFKEESFEREFARIYDDTFYSMESSMLNPRRLYANEYVKYVQTILNWDDEAYWRDERTDIRRTNYDPKKYIRNSFLEPGNRLYVEDDDETLRVGSKYIGIMSVKEYPEYIAIHDIVKLFGDVKDGTNQGAKGHFLFTANIVFEDPNKEKSKFEKKKLSNQRQAFGQIASWVPEYGRRQADFDSMKAQLDEGSMIARVMHTFTLFGDTKRQLDSTCASMRNFWNGKEFEFHREKYIALPVFLNQIPLNAEYEVVNHLGRYWRMPTEVITHTLPMVTEWGGGFSPAMLMTSRLGEPKYFDTFESATSPNNLIVAESGSGKSVLAQFIIASYMAYRDPKILGNKMWVIDIGYSYKRLCTRLNGTYLDWAKEDLCINPFENIKTEENYKESSEMLIGILTVMAFSQESPTSLQVAGLRQHMKTVWEKKKENTMIDDIAISLSGDEQQEIRNIGRQLYAYTSKGDFGEYFNGKSNVDLESSDFIVLELEGLKDSEELQRTVLYILMMSIAQHVDNLPLEIRKQIFLDEGWRLMSKSEAVAKFMEGMYRTIRKKQGACTFISQNLGDLTINPSGQAILQNSPNKMLLGQSESSVLQAKKSESIVLDDYGWQVLQGVKTKKNKYSEIFAMQGRQYGVLRLVMSRENLLLFTTDPDEVSLITNLENSGYSPSEAIQEIVRAEKNGTINQLRQEMSAMAMKRFNEHSQQRMINN